MQTASTSKGNWGSSAYFLEDDLHRAWPITSAHEVLHADDDKYYYSSMMSSGGVWISSRARSLPMGMEKASGS